MLSHEHTSFLPQVYNTSLSMTEMEPIERTKPTRTHITRQLTHTTHHTRTTLHTSTHARALKPGAAELRDGDMLLGWRTYGIAHGPKQIKLESGSSSSRPMMG